MTLRVEDKEIILQDLWKRRKLFAGGLTTLTGKAVEILYAGNHNHDTGPDFKDAVIKIGGVLLQGDVEVHLEIGGWEAHKHHEDAAYNRVILHVIGGEKPEKKVIRREDGVDVDQVWIKLDTATIDAWEGTRVARSDASVIVQDCPLSRRRLAQIYATLDSAGERRFNNKVDQLRENLLTRSWDQAIYIRLLEALGYSINQKPFRKLAILVPFERVCSEMQWVEEEMAVLRCTALLFGAAGLLPVSRQSRELLDKNTLQYLTPVFDLWEGMRRRLELKPMRAHEWQFFRLRPSNFPTRRLAGLVQFMMNVYKHGFLPALLQTVHGNMSDFRKLKSELETMLVRKADNFWSNRYMLNGKNTDRSPVRREPLLIGKERSRDIMINIFLPALYLYGCEANDGNLKNIVLELYRSSGKLADNVITRKMYKQLSALQPGTLDVKFARQQQGLLHLNKIYCRELKCDVCLKLSDWQDTDPVVSVNSTGDKDAA